MNNSPSPAFIPDLLSELSAFVTLGEDALAFISDEHRALTSSEKYEPFKFYHFRKDLLVRINSLIVSIKHWRQLWQQISPAERASHPEVKVVIQRIQNLLVKFLQLDRENQQALLRRGLVPTSHVNECAAPPSNFVANLYRRYNSR